MRPAFVFWAEFGVVALESLTFLLVGYRLCKRHPWFQYVAVTVGAACMSYRVLTSTFPDRFYIHSSYVVLPGLIAPAGFLLLAGALTLAVSKPRQRIIVGVFSVVLTYYVFCDAAYLAVKGPEIAQLKGRWEQETMRQSRPFTCGPAAAAALLRAWGITVTEGDLACAARTSFRGTELPRLAESIRFFGRDKPLTVKILSTTFARLREIDRPAVLLVRKSRRPHAVALLKAANNRLLIADPSGGTREMHVGDFGRLYEWDGCAIVAWRDPAFSRLPGEPLEPPLQY